MPRPTKGARLGGSPAHERLILANLATELFKHGKIRTTVTKAKRLRPLAEKLITKARKGDIHNRRLVLTVVRDKSVVHHLFTEIAEQMAERPGGYTRITKIGARKGDNAPMAVIELVTEPLNKATVTKAKAAPAAAEAETAEAAETAVEAVAETETEEAQAEEPEAAEAPAEEKAEPKAKAAKKAKAEEKDEA